MDQTPEYCLSPTCSALFQTRSMLQEITEQNDRLEAVNRDLNASRNDWKALAESKSARVAELERRLADEERGHGQTIDERDRYHDWADKLAQAIAEHMRDDIGEHSSANNPWANALKLIDGTFCR